jgi:hypothetical protein
MNIATSQDNIYSWQLSNDMQIKIIRWTNNYEQNQTLPTMYPLNLCPIVLYTHYSKTPILQSHTSCFLQFYPHFVWS